MYVDVQETEGTNVSNGAASSLVRISVTKEGCEISSQGTYVHVEGTSSHTDNTRAMFSHCPRRALNIQRRASECKECYCF